MVVMPNVNAVTGDPYVSNTAVVTFDMAPFTDLVQASNTDIFQVLGRVNGLNSATVTVTSPYTGKVMAGSFVPIHIKIVNTGVFSLTGLTLSISAHGNSQLLTTEQETTLITSITNDNITTFNVSVSDIGENSETTIETILNIPMDINITNNTLYAELFGNGIANISNDSLTLDLRERTVATMELLQYSLSPDVSPILIPTTEYKTQANSFSSVTIPEIPGKPGVLVTDEPIRLKAHNNFSHNQTLFVRIIDHDQNSDPTLTETVEITFNIDALNETETIRLTETGPDTGTFIGFISMGTGAVMPYNGKLDVSSNVSVSAFYADDIDISDTSSYSIIVDPFGIVIDSATGALMDGYTIEMVNTNTGLPANVVGDDGVSSYPSTVISGGVAVDASGKVYSFDTGAYRFPFAPVGNYKLIATPPAGDAYLWPTGKTTELINQLPGAPFEIVLGSRGESFPLIDGPPLHIDIPVDPTNAQLHVIRSADKTALAAGDFIRFKVEVENIANADLTQVIISDTLPRTMRYVSGTLTIDGTTAVDPVIDNITGNPNFALGNLAMGQKITIDYLAAVGAARPGSVESGSFAIANGGAANSNTARLNTLITDELMRSKAILMGQVIIDNVETLKDEYPHRGLANVRIYMEDGHYAVTDERGMYHFEDITPGSHVLQIDETTLPDNFTVVASEQNSRFAGSAISQFVDVKGGTLWKTDFYVAKHENPKSSFSFSMHNKETVLEQTMEYSLNISVKGLAIDNLRLTVAIPEELVYIEGSSKLAGAARNDPTVNDNFLIYRLGDFSKDTDTELNFKVSGINAAKSDTLKSIAFIVYDLGAAKNERSPKLSHVINLKEILPAFTKENLSQPQVTVGTSVPAVLDNNTTSGNGDEIPIADNNIASDHIINVPGTLPREKLPITQTTSETISVMTEGTFVPETTTPGTELGETPPPMLKYDSQWLAEADSSIEWLVPEGDAIPKLTSTEILIKHQSNHKVNVKLNDEYVSDANFSGSRSNQINAKVSLWTGVDLKIGNNRMEAIITDEENNIVKQIRRIVHVAGAPASATVLKSKSVLVADGRTYPVISLNINDSDGFPLREGMSGQFRVLPPHQTKKNSAFDGTQLAGVPEKLLTYTTGKDGVTYIVLEPANQPGEVKIELLLEHDEKTQVSVQLTPEKRDWILVGLGESGINTRDMHDNLTTSSNGNENLYNNRISFFTKGQVSGEWLLTAAYDSDRAVNKDQAPHIFSAIDPGQYYTIYGDSSNNGFDAASTEKLYLRLERDEFHIMFGDYITDLNKTELAKYNRTFTGVKSRYANDNYELIMFGADTNQAFVRDEIRGDGTSGPYRLSRNNVALNTERVTIEVRDRFHSETIIDSQELARHRDYDIDYATGTLRFTRPIFSIDQNLNQRFVVVSFEAHDNRDSQLTIGGRGAIKLSDNTTVGITRVEEGRTGGSANLTGIDINYDLNSQTNIQIESAHSVDFKLTGDHAKGSAHLAKITYETITLDSKAYIHEQDVGFGLGQTNSSEESTRKIGTMAKYRFSKQLTLSGEAYRQEQTGTNTTRDVFDTQAGYQVDNSSLRAGLRSAADKRGDGSKQKSNQIITGITQSLLDNRLALNLDRETNLNSGATNSVDFPDRTHWGADYKLTAKTTVFLSQEITDGDLLDTRSTILGIRANPWFGSEVYTGINHSQTDMLENTSANIAIRQVFELNDQWSLDVGAEESKILSQVDNVQFSNNVPLASGNTQDFTATSLGLTYRPVDWIWTGRIENRNADFDDRTTVDTAIQTDANTNLSLLASLSSVKNTSVALGNNSSHNITLGTAYRPIDGHWVILDKLEIKLDDQQGALNSKTWRAINHLHANYKPQSNWQVSMQYAAKKVQQRNNDTKSHSFTDLTGLELRYDISKKIDIGLHGNILHAWDMKQYDYSSGASIGYVVAKNIWISVGFNFDGFHDEDFSRNNNIEKGSFIKFRFKFDQQTTKEGLAWLKY
jgi:uncharacterized repeat protein (TIGR01451 family)